MPAIGHARSHGPCARSQSYSCGRGARRAQGTSPSSAVTRTSLHIINPHAQLSIFLPALLQICRKFLDPYKPDLKMQQIVVNISSEGIVLATPEEDGVVAHHRMECISFAAGGDYEDYDVVAYVAKGRLGRMVYVFDCGDNSNQVLATIGQAFVSAGQRAEEEDEAFADLAGEFDEWARVAEQFGSKSESCGLTKREMGLGQDKAADWTVAALAIFFARLQVPTPPRSFLLPSSQIQPSDQLSTREYEALYGTSPTNGNYQEVQKVERDGSYATLRSEDAQSAGGRKHRRESGRRYHTLSRGRDDGSANYEDAGAVVRRGATELEVLDFAPRSQQPVFCSIQQTPRAHAYEDMPHGETPYSEASVLHEANPNYYDVTADIEDDIEYDLASGDGSRDQQRVVRARGRDPTHYDLASDQDHYHEFSAPAKPAGTSGYEYQEARRDADHNGLDEANPNYHEVTATEETGDHYHEYSAAAMEDRLYDMVGKKE